MKETRMQLNFLGLWDQQAIVDKLEAMAAQGWMIQKMGNFFWTYTKIEPRNRRFRVTYFPTVSPYDPGPSQGQLTREELCARDGWQLAVRRDVAQVFYTDREDAVPIDTDPVLQVEAVRQAYNRRELPSRLATTFLSGFYIFIQLQNFFRDPAEFLCSNYHLFALLAWAVLFVFYLWGTVRDLLWLNRATRDALEKGTFLPPRSYAGAEMVLTVLAILLVVFSLAGLDGGNVYILLWMGCMGLMFWVTASLRNFLKKQGFSAAFNRVVTTVTSVVLTMVLLGGVIWLGVSGGISTREESQPVGSYTIEGYTFDIYDDSLPLTVEDLVSLEAQWSREANFRSSFLLTQEQYRQDLIPGQEITNYEMTYTIYRPANGWVYDTVRRGLINSRQDEVGDGYVFTDHYQQIDPTLWNAREVYQAYWSDSLLDTYLVCWEDKILEIKFYWQPTQEQIAAAAEILKEA